MRVKVRLHRKKIPNLSINVHQKIKFLPLLRRRKKTVPAEKILKLILIKTPKGNPEQLQNERLQRQRKQRRFVHAYHSIPQIVIIYIFVFIFQGGTAKVTAFTRPLTLSPALAALMGAESLPRHEVVKKVWAIIKERNLYDPKNKQYAVCDDELHKIMGVKRFRTFGMLKYLKTHFTD